MKNKGHSLRISGLWSIGVIASKSTRQHCVGVACNHRNFFSVVKEQRDRRGQDRVPSPSEARISDLQTFEEASRYRLCHHSVVLSWGSAPQPLGDTVTEGYRRNQVIEFVLNT